MNEQMKKIILLFSISLILSLNAFSQGRVIDRIVAVIGNEVILESELNYAAYYYAQRMKVNSEDRAFKLEVLNELITNKLVLAQAVIDSIDVTDEEVDKKVNEDIKSMIMRFGSEEKLVQYANMSIAKLKNERRAESKKDMIVQKMMGLRLGNLSISRREVEDYYSSMKDSLPTIPEEVELYHIQIFPKPNLEIKNQIYKKALAVLDSIKQGASFEEMAKKYSDHVSGKTGGDLPLVKRGTLVREYEEAAFALEAGQISNVIESPLGYHIIKLVERRGEAILTKQILFKIQKSTSDDDDAKALLSNLRERALKGEKFGELARKYSESSETKDLGGYLGRFPLDNLSSDLADAIKNLKDGGVSEPQRVSVGSGYAYQIIFLSKRIPEHKLSLTDDISKIENYVRKKKEADELKKWVEEIKKNVYWEIKF